MDWNLLLALAYIWLLFCGWAKERGHFGPEFWIAAFSPVVMVTTFLVAFVFNILAPPTVTADAFLLLFYLYFLLPIPGMTWLSAAFGWRKRLSRPVPEPTTVETEVEFRAKLRDWTIRAVNWSALTLMIAGGLFGTVQGYHVGVALADQWGKQFDTIGAFIGAALGGVVIFFLIWSLNTAGLAILMWLTDRFNLFDIVDILLRFPFIISGATLGALVGVAWLGDVILGLLLGVALSDLLFRVVARGNPLNSGQWTLKRKNSARDEGKTNGG